jgi:hypothetical protein
MRARFSVEAARDRMREDLAAISGGVRSGRRPGRVTPRGEDVRC